MTSVSRPGHNNYWFERMMEFDKISPKIFACESVVGVPYNIRTEMNGYRRTYLQNIRTGYEFPAGTYVYNFQKSNSFKASSMAILNVCAKWTGGSNPQEGSTDCSLMDSVNYASSSYLFPVHQNRYTLSFLDGHADLITGPEYVKKYKQADPINL